MNLHSFFKQGLGFGVSMFSFVLIQVCVVFVLAGCSMSKDEKILNKMRELEPSEISRVEMVYPRRLFFRIDAPPLCQDVDASQFSVMCAALKSAELQKELLGILAVDILIIKIFDKHGDIMSEISFVRGALMQLSTEETGLRFYCRDLQNWAAPYHAKMEMEFLTSILTVKPDFDFSHPVFNGVIRRLRRWLPFYDFSEFDTNPKTAAEAFMEWYPANKDKFVWVAAEGHYALQE